MTNKFSLKIFDILGTEFTLNYRKSSRFKTNIGGLLSLFSLITIFFAFLVTTRKYLRTTSPEVSISIKHSRRYHKINLKEEIIYTAFGFYTAPNILETSKLNRFVTIVGLMYKIDFDEISNIVNGSVIEVIPYVPCNLLEEDNVIQSAYLGNTNKNEEILNQNFGMCPNLTNLTNYSVEGKLNEVPWVYPMIAILPCTLPDPAQCASLEEINRLETKYTTLDKAIDPSNKKNPLSYFPNFDGSLSFSTLQSKVVTQKLKLNEIYDDDQDFFEERLILKYADVDSLEIDTTLRNSTQNHCDISSLFSTCTPYFTFVYFSTGKTVITKRTYVKFFESLAELGGNAEIIMILALLIYVKYNEWRLNKYLKLEAFKVDLKNGGYGIIKDNDTNNENDKKNNYDDILESELSKKQDGIELIKSLSNVDIMEDILFEPYEKILLPFVFLNMRKKEIKKEEKDPKFVTKEDYQKALDKVRMSTPENEIKRMIKEFLLRNLPPQGEALFNEEELQHEIKDQEKKSILNENLGRRRKSRPKIHSKNLQKHGGNKLNGKEHKKRDTINKADAWNID